MGNNKSSCKDQILDASNNVKLLAEQYEKLGIGTGTCSGDLLSANTEMSSLKIKLNNLANPAYCSGTLSGQEQTQSSIIQQIINAGGSVSGYSGYSGIIGGSVPSGVCSAQALFNQSSINNSLSSQYDILQGSISGLSSQITGLNDN